MFSKPHTLIWVVWFIGDTFLNHFYFVTFCLIIDKRNKNYMPIIVPLTKHMLKAFSHLLFTSIRNLLAHIVRDRMLSLYKKMARTEHTSRTKNRQQRRRIKASLSDKHQEGSQEDFCFAEHKRRQQKILQVLLVQKEVQENKRLLVDG